MQCIKYSYLVGKRVKFGPKTRTSCEEMGDLSKKVNLNITAPLWDDEDNKSFCRKPLDRLIQYKKRHNNPSTDKQMKVVQCVCLPNALLLSVCRQKDAESTAGCH